MTAREIAAVLVGHPLLTSHDERLLDLCGGCVWSGRGRVEHAEHVAELIEALGRESWDGPNTAVSCICGFYRITDAFERAELEYINHIPVGSTE